MNVNTMVVSESQEGRVGEVVEVLDHEDVVVRWNDTGLTSEESVEDLTAMQA